jgi:hypothetical protein
MPPSHCTSVDQDLRHGVFRGGVGFLLVGNVHGLDEVDRVVVGNELQRVGYTFDQVVCTDHGRHGGWPLSVCWWAESFCNMARKSRLHIVTILHHQTKQTNLIYAYTGIIPRVRGCSKRIRTR